MCKYGVDNFKFRIIEECSDDKVEEREIHYIDKYNTFYEGYNATLGGNIRHDNDYKPITQYSKKGERLRDFLSLKDAADFIGREQTAISRCANGQRFSAYGYRWGWKGNGILQLDTKYLKPIYAYNRRGEYREWISVSDAIRETGCHRKNVHNSIISPPDNKKSSKGWYFFRFEDGRFDYTDITFAKRYKPTREKAQEMVKIRQRNKT